VKKVIFFLVLFTAVSLFAFPLRNMAKEAVIDLNRFQYDGGYKPDADKTPVKLLFLWHSDKRLNIKQYVSFVEICTANRITCIAVDKLGATHKDPYIVSAKDNEGYCDSFGLVAMPATVILDKDNKIIDAVGYEGQYFEKMTKTINSLYPK